MSNTRWMGTAVAGGLLLGLLAAWNSASSGQGPPSRASQRWEYTIHAGGSENHVEALNRLGGQGWELVAAHNTDSHRPVYYVLKRPKP